MAKPVGLRTEIIVNVVLLLAAALLFSGFLLLKLTERELVAQQVAAFSAVAETLASSMAMSANDAERWSAPTAAQVEAWSLVDENLQLVNQLSQRSDFTVDMAVLRTVRQSLEQKQRLVYAGSSWFSNNSGNHLLISSPLLRDGQFVGAVQLRFSLEELSGRIRNAQSWFVGYVLVYGALLSAFGFYLLNRNVVRPIGRLRIATERIAAGDLELTPRVTGPREIAELAESFAEMVAALKASRAETEEYIVSLEAANKELRTAQRRLARSEKLATVGHLAAGMAHEIGNPLGAVSGYLELMRDEPDPSRARDLVDRAAAEAARIDRLVRDLLDYARPSDDLPEDVDVNNVVDTAIAMLKHQGVFDGRRFACAGEKQPLTVRIDRHRLQQVLVNLLLNARDATVAGEEIALATDRVNGQVRITVRDNGCGMSPEVIEHIFDPFYTTKDSEQGRGLGLAVCYRIIEDAGGTIDVASRSGGGTTFTLLLPSVDAAVEDHHD